MLQMCIDMKLFFYGMIATGIVGVWCLFWNNRFFNTAIRDLKRKDKPKGRWTSRLLEQGRTKSLNNPESFIRAKLTEGRQAGINLLHLSQAVNIALCLCAVLFAVSSYGVLRYRYEMYVMRQHGILAGSIIAGLLMIRFCMNLSEKEEVVVDGWRDYFENEAAGIVAAAVSKEQAKERAQPEVFPATEQERAQLKKKKEKRSGLQPRSEEQITQIEKGIREAAASDSRFAGVLTPEEEKLFREVIREYL